MGKCHFQLWWSHPTQLTIKTKEYSKHHEKLIKEQEAQEWMEERFRMTKHPLELNQPFRNGKSTAQLSFCLEHAVPKSVNVLEWTI